MSLLWGCASTGKRKEGDTPLVALKAACSAGTKLKGLPISEVTGNIWMNVKSPEASGQFPAAVRALHGQGSGVKIEITNLVGGPVAWIEVNPNYYRVKSYDGRFKEITGTKEWAGIPIEFAIQLFSGKFPCPDDPQGFKNAEWIEKEGDAWVSLESSSGQFQYLFRTFQGSYWPEKLNWSQGREKVEMTFDQPDSDSLSPGKWHAKGPLGEIQVRWKDRKFSVKSTGS